MTELPTETALELPYLDTPRKDEALVRQLAVANIAEYAIAAQFHRINQSDEPVRVDGVLLERRQAPDGRYVIYRDPLTGDVYKTQSRHE